VTAADVANLRITHYPAEILRRKAEPIDPSAQVLDVAQTMLKLMVKAEGIGLAAPQVGLPWRLFVVNVPPPSPDDTDFDPGSYQGLPIATTGPKVYINPTLSDAEGELEGYEEGCLSLPDIRGMVYRPPIITISALDENGKPFTERAAGLLARCWQHEFDHLDGVLILDKMTQMSRLKNRRAVRELEKEAGLR
jgi:peptide deformylase